MSHEIKYFVRVIIKNVYVIILTPILILFAIVSRILNFRKGIGLGPEPLINNVYHKKALEKYGYTAETFVTDTYFITSEFDKVFKLPMREYILL